MSDDFLQFSSGFSVTPEEAEWLEMKLMNPPIEWFDEFEIRRIEQGVVDPQELLDFEWSTRGSNPVQFTFWADSSGNPEHVINLLKSFLAVFRPTEKLGFSYAYTCSKPRIDSFGGGAVVVSYDNVEAIDTLPWLEERVT